MQVTSASCCIRFRTSIPTSLHNLFNHLFIPVQCCIYAGINEHLLLYDTLLLSVPTSNSCTMGLEGVWVLYPEYGIMVFTRAKPDGISLYHTKVIGTMVYIEP